MSDKRMQDLEKELEKVKTERDELQQLFSMSIDLVCVAEIETSEFVRLNQAASTILGYEAEEMVGQSFFDFIHPDDVQTTRTIVRAALKKGEKIVNFRNRYICKDGTCRWLSWSAQADEKRRFVYAMARDITEHKRNEDLLNSRHQLMNTLLDNLQVGIFMADAPSGRALLANKKAKELLGRTDMPGEESIFLSEFYQVFQSGTGNLYPEEQLPISKGLKGQSHHVDDMIVRRPDGREVFLEVFGSPVKDGAGQVTASLVSFSDITQRKKDEAAISRLSREWQTTFNAINAAIWVLDEKQVITRSNKMAETLFNLPEGEMIGRHCWEIVHNTLEPIPECPVLRAKKTKKRESMEIRMGEACFEVTVDPVFEKDGAFKQAVHIIADITERKKKEEQIRRREEEYRLLVENQTDLVVKIDTDGRFEFVSPSYCAMFGKTQEELIGEPFMPMVHPDDRQTTEQVMKNLFEPPYTAYIEQRAMTAEGWKWLAWVDTAVLDANNEVKAVIGVGRDINDLKAMQKELRHAHKLESVGVLAGGIAHDFNNILSIILGNSELALDEEITPLTEESLEEIKAASLRAKGIIKQLLSFSRKADQEIQPLDIRPIVKESVKLIRASLPSNISIQNRIHEFQKAVLADATQIHQVIINLCSNAADAMPAGGRLEIEVEQVSFDSLPPERGIDLSPGDYLALRIRDNGSGIAPEIKEKIFDPYFTTKEVGKGSGMGLSVVIGIVKSHNGAIFADSEPGQGSCFTVLLPTTSDGSQHSASPADDLAEGGTERILFVDDEAAIAEMTGRILERLGYTVEVQTNPLTALNRVGEMPAGYDVLITDLTMPGMSGLELAEKAKGFSPDLPIIVCTGHSQGVNEEMTSGRDIDICLVKPVSKAELSAAIRRVLAQ